MINRDEIYTDEILLHRKREESGKTPKKAKHKHIYADCLYDIMDNTYDRQRGFVKEPKQVSGTYCTICGKVGDIQYLRLGGEQDKRPKDELNNLPVFKLDDIWKQKYINEGDK